MGVQHTLLSLFDGSGGFPFAATICDIVPIACSEIEPYPIAVTRSRFPNMLHLGDICCINGAEIEPADVISLGSPCQSFSQAGKREGLKHTELGDTETTRSGLFIEAIRVIKQMREATGGEYPKFIIFENVPGIFSSKNGEDFRTVLEEFIKIVEPTAVMPPVPKGGWAYADSYRGDGWSLSYRLFDARHWGKAVRDASSGTLLFPGTPQRRRRIHLVLDLTGDRAEGILFDPHRLYWDHSPLKSSWETTTNVYGNGTEVHNRTVIAAYTMQGFGDYKDCGVASSLKARDYKDATDIVIEQHFDINGNVRYAARRLTPTEHSRLNGFPDYYEEIDRKEDLSDEEYRFWLQVRNTHERINKRKEKEYTKGQMLSWYNNLPTNKAKFQLWGNGIALPPALYCMRGIADALNEMYEQREYS